MLRCAQTLGQDLVVMDFHGGESGGVLKEVRCAVLCCDVTCGGVLCRSGMHYATVLLRCTVFSTVLG